MAAPGVTPPEGTGVRGAGLCPVAEPQGTTCGSTTAVTLCGSAAWRRKRPADAHGDADAHSDHEAPPSANPH